MITSTRIRNQFNGTTQVQVKDQALFPLMIGCQITTTQIDTTPSLNSGKDQLGAQHGCLAGYEWSGLGRGEFENLIAQLAPHSTQCDESLSISKIHIKKN